MGIEGEGSEVGSVTLDRDRRACVTLGMTVMPNDTPVAAGQTKVTLPSDPRPYLPMGRPPL